MPSKTPLKKKGIICDDCWQHQEEWACGHLKRIITPLKMCAKHRRLDSYFVDYQMQTTTLEESCAACKKKEDAEIVVMEKREEVQRVVGEMKRIREMSEDEFTAEVAKIEKSIMQEG
ncbi:hypothetical protein G7Y89_g7775 [Cudoniella acicularis]|uniref:Uncharacterized protein n=1 Tax=Cudoniella acicularis TaxID=354080 RepID=A0A8H4W1M6_9HELO|nr:hypothetical protein G7Y89_g7775 [Cudoniella acicularis]